MAGTTTLTSSPLRVCLPSGRRMPVLVAATPVKINKNSTATCWTVIIASCMGRILLCYGRCTHLHL